MSNSWTAMGPGGYLSTRPATQTWPVSPPHDRRRVGSIQSVQSGSEPHLPIEPSLLKTINQDHIKFNLIYIVNNIYIRYNILKQFDGQGWAGRLIPRPALTCVWVGARPGPTLFLVLVRSGRSGRAGFAILGLKPDVAQPFMYM